MVGLERDVSQLIVEWVEVVQPARDDAAELIDPEGVAEIVQFDDRQLERVHVTRPASRRTAAQRPSH
jgi:hypothetical protein